MFTLKSNEIPAFIHGTFKPFFLLFLQAHFFLIQIVSHFILWILALAWRMCNNKYRKSYFPNTTLTIHRMCTTVHTWSHSISCSISRGDKPLTCSSRVFAVVAKKSSNDVTSFFTFFAYRNAFSKSAFLCVTYLEFYTDFIQISFSLPNCSPLQ